MTISATDLVSLLRSEANSLANNTSVSSIFGITFLFKTGTERTIKFNPDKSWRVKPAEVNGLVKFEWTDAMNDSMFSVEGSPSTYTVEEHVEKVYVDPEELETFRFNYTITRVSNVVIQADEE
jgi:hypothetical protein